MLFSAAFSQSRNAMVLLDDQRRYVDVNGAYLNLLGYPRGALIGCPVYEHVKDGPLASPQEWMSALDEGRFTGEADLVRSDGGGVGVQWAAHTEAATGRRLVLFVVLNTSRWGRSFRRVPDAEADPGPVALSGRESEVVRLIALGSTSTEIADELRIAPHTVRTHVRNAMAKLHARSRAQLVAKALGDGLILD
ncbi:MAG TPA: LuxR C-terminal-related transcriptional regulator [Baekduia sp.]